MENQKEEFEEKKKSSILDALRKFWHFIWEEESLTSYVVFIVLSFLILKFLIFPAILFFTGYSDIAAVVSSSMQHGDDIKYTYYNWLEFNNFSLEEVKNWPYQNGLNIGDVVFVKKVPQEDIHVGDIILFNTERGQIIHRVVFIKKVNGDYYYTTKGDANGMISELEKDIPYDKIKGKLVYKIPYLGYPKYLLTYILPI